MDYVQRNLGKNEKIVLRAKINWLALLVPILWAVLVEIAWSMFKKKVVGEIDPSTTTGDDPTKQIFNVFAVVSQIIAFLPAIVRFLVLANEKLVITNKRIVGKVGILRVDTIDFPIEKVDNVTYNAGIFGNLFKYYTLQITGTSGDKKELKMVANAQAFKNAVSEAIERHAEEARKAQAAEIAAAMGNKPQM